jgi:hypothetical protein
VDADTNATAVCAQSRKEKPLNKATLKRVKIIAGIVLLACLIVGCAVVCLLASWLAQMPQR